MNFTYQEKFDLIIQEIIKEKPTSLHGIINLHLTNENKLAPIGKKDALSILEKFQAETGAIEVLEANYPERRIGLKILPLDAKETGFHAIKTTHRRPPLIKDPHPDLIYISLTNNFDNWHSAYLIRINRKLEDLSQDNFLKVFKLTEEINKKFQMVSVPHFEISIDMDCEDTLKFLYDKSILADYSQKFTGILVTHTIALILNVDRFINFYTQIQEIYQKRFQNQIKNEEPKTSLLKLPPDINWEDIEIKFLNEEIVNITMNKKTYKASFQKMGFEDKRNGSPDKQWKFLYLLALNKGQISWKDSQANLDISKKKQLLSKALKKYFNLVDDPFFPYKQEKCYAIKIQLSAEKRLYSSD